MKSGRLGTPDAVAHIGVLGIFRPNATFRLLSD